MAYIPIYVAEQFTCYSYLEQVVSVWLQVNKAQQPVRHSGKNNIVHVLGENKPLDSLLKHQNTQLVITIMSGIWMACRGQP